MGTCETCVYWEGGDCLNPVSPWWRESVQSDDSCPDWEGNMEEES